MVSAPLPKPRPPRTARQTSKALGQALAALDKRITYKTVRAFFCECDHIDFAHGVLGTGACEGVVSELDGYAEFGPCPCSKFKVAS